MEIFTIRFRGYSANKEFVWKYLRSDLGGTNTGKLLIMTTYLASKVYCLLSFCYFVLIEAI